jgi:prepilin-type N-terminal cleavage/methylation domain-containing protein
MKKHKNNNAFTLIELLVVISIIAILMAVLVPSLRKAKQQAEKVVCSSRLKDVGSAVGIYSLENDGKMVSSSVYRARWYDLLGSYIYDVGRNSGDYTGNANRDSFPGLMCPVSERLHTKFMKNQGEDASGTMYGYSLKYRWLNVFGYNLFFQCPGRELDRYHYTPDPNFKYRWYSKLDRVKMPGELPVFWCANARLDLTPTIRQLGFDGYPGATACEHGWASDISPNSRGDYCNVSGPAANHGGASFNFLMADMHAETKGKWIYEDTFRNPSKNAADYFKYFHPMRSNNPTETIGDQWPGRIILNTPVID